MAKHVWGNAVGKAQPEESAKPSLTIAKPAWPRPSLTMSTQQNPQAQAKSASTELAETSHSQQSPMAPSHRPTLQHHPTSETLHNTGKCWLSALF